VPAQVLGGIPLAPAGTLEDDLDTSDVDFQHWFRAADRHRVTWGAAYRFTHDEVVNAPGLGFEPPVLDDHLASVFVQDEVSLSPTVAITAGTKVEHNGYTGLELEPSARVRWNVTPTRMVWAAVSRAVRAPARVDRDERLGTPGLAPFVENLLVGGADFVSETLVAYEAGTRAQFGPFVSVSLSTFYNRYANLRSTNLSPPDPVLQLPFPLFFENDLEATTYGAEMGADVQATAWGRPPAGAAFLGADVRVAPGGFDFNAALNETADPDHQVFVRSSMNLPTNVELDATFRRVGAFEFNQSGVPGMVPGYGELDARVAWHPSQAVEHSVAAQNLLHGQHLEYVISSPNPRGEIRRRVYGRVTFRW
jgi:iron complex outermembrane receptor protein